LTTSSVPAPPAMGRSIFGSIAGKIDEFFATKYRRLGLLVGSRPLTTIGISLLVAGLLGSGLSQMKSESRADKLWIPQDTQAQKDEATFTSYFPSDVRQESILLEAVSGNALEKSALVAALSLHLEIEAITSTADGVDDNLRSLCVASSGTSHPCYISSVFEAWGYDLATLSADPDPLATLNGLGKSMQDLNRILGAVQFDANGKVLSANAVSIKYFLQSHRVVVKGEYEDPRGEGWEEAVLEYLKCDETKCSDDGVCVCGYQSSVVRVFPSFQRSWSDAFGAVIKGDVGLISGAFVIMIWYLVLNLGFLGHKVKARTLLAWGCVISIVCAGVSGYGISMWSQFIYSPVHGVLPFVILGIGVDDSFVIMNAFDRTDPTKSIPERIGDTLASAGVSIMVTSLTDFVAFAISVSSALPALSSFCFYMALCVLIIFTMQVTIFTPMVALDAARVEKNLPFCCSCLPKKALCCKIVPKEDAEQAISKGEPDPNQMCCAPPAHKGGNIGRFMENVLAPAITRTPIAIGIVFVLLALSGFSTWRATELRVENTQRNFVPDDSYLLSTLRKQDLYFGNLGTRFNIMTMPGDYFSKQKELVDIEHRLSELDYIITPSSETFSSWASDFKAACAAGTTGTSVTVDSDGFVTTESQYYEALGTWLAAAGAKHASNIVWVDSSNLEKGIFATKMTAYIRSVNKQVGDRITANSDEAIKALDEIQTACSSWTDLPGGKAIPYSYSFLSWETFKIIAEQMWFSLLQCLGAVLIITLGLIAHPLTSILVFLCVLMTIVDIIGFMQLWGLSIDSVLVIQLVIAVGLSVDYAAHVGHNFMMQEGASRIERTVKTMGDVGAAVLSGGISTFLGVMLLALSKSYVFRVMFQSFFLTVIFGLVHGMVFLPACLSLVGPPSYHGEEAKVVDGNPAMEDNCK